MGREEEYQQSKGYQRLFGKCYDLILVQGFDFGEILIADSYPDDTEELATRKQELELEGLEVMVMPFAFDKETGNNINGRTILKRPKQEAQR